MNDPCDALFEDIEPIQPFSIAYVKGMTRSCSILSLLFYLFRQKVEIISRLPVLYVSILKVFGHAKPLGNKIDEAFENMKLSLRGEIRKAVNLIQLAMMVHKLTEKYGLTDFPSFVRKWNTASSRAHQILGKKASALKMLFGVAPRVFDVK